jgi:hypothetical protein
MGLLLASLSHVEARAYLGDDEAQKELCSVALTDYYSSKLAKSPNFCFKFLSLTN